MSGAVAELASELRRSYDSAPKSRKAASIHLFGIAHAETLRSVSKAEVVERAGLPVSYVTELNKGTNLAEYVQIVKPLA
ncbi:hypothetical protein [Sphingomonas sp.]|uniref:HTH-like domain-containing protein n=1 Tax=Sphingomonas sp. TaxID=28214 RepID=UPI0025ED25C4|nr:hypothetical protein [Sphingomonas sp.]